MSDVGKWLRSNQGIGVVLSLILTVSIVWIELSPWAHEETRDGFTLGFFPVLSMALILFFTLILTVDIRRKETTEGVATFSLKSLFNSVLFLLGTWIYFELMQRIGFLIITPVYLFLFIYILGIKIWRTCVYSAFIMTITVYVVFSAISIKLPKGILENFLPF